ncbi:hypothetical protein HJG60_008797 [Phyllostomus discolor]|uniref:Uncharacterized protein n=1 Tax=Phyllostomus discolor TaxID=89673 RepID=A0A833YWA1_9CHIR|nr:hypothetical protein HJG60_008797 [Phyllostomus discolor]
MQPPGGGAAAALLVPFFLSYQLNTIFTVRGISRGDTALVAASALELIDDVTGSPEDTGPVSFTTSMGTCQLWQQGDSPRPTLMDPAGPRLRTTAEVPIEGWPRLESADQRLGRAYLCEEGPVHHCRSGEKPCQCALPALQATAQPPAAGAVPLRLALKAERSARCRLRASKVVWSGLVGMRPRLAGGTAELGSQGQGGSPGWGGRWPSPLGSL